jgi:hypothetical protein
LGCRWEREGAQSTIWGKTKRFEDVAHRYDGEDGAYSLKVFVWPAGTGTKIYDHSSWGAYCCAAGTVLEERYERLDDGSRAGHARLKKFWRLWWSPEAEDSVMRPRAHHAKE